MPLVSMNWHGNGIKLLSQATEALGSESKGKRVYAMARKPFRTKQTPCARFSPMPHSLPSSNA